MKFFEWQLGRASELAVNLRFCVGQVDAEKLAQRSSVAAWVLSCWSECALCHLNSPRCFPNDWMTNSYLMDYVTVGHPKTPQSAAVLTGCSVLFSSKTKCQVGDSCFSPFTACSSYSYVRLGAFLGASSLSPARTTARPCFVSLQSSHRKSS